jgi:hypothetical protein
VTAVTPRTADVGLSQHPIQHVDLILGVLLAMTAGE